MYWVALLEAQRHELGEGCGCFENFQYKYVTRLIHVVMGTLRLWLGRLKEVDTNLDRLKDASPLIDVAGNPWGSRLSPVVSPFAAAREKSVKLEMGFGWKIPGLLSRRARCLLPSRFSVNPACEYSATTRYTTLPLISKIGKQKN